MKLLLRNTFVPHEGNDNIPHLFEEMGVFVVVSLLLGLFVLGQSPALYMSSQRAAVLPAVLVDLAKTDTVSATASKCGWSPYMGHTLTGWPCYTIMRGQVFPL